jgi:hypothetical protein
LGKRARREISERFRAYHESVIRMVEPDSEAFFNRAVERARHEHRTLEAQAERAQV